MLLGFPEKDGVGTVQAHVKPPSTPGLRSPAGVRDSEQPLRSSWEGSARASALLCCGVAAQLFPPGFPAPAMPASAGTVPTPPHNLQSPWGS